MSEGYTINDRRGKRDDEPKPCCRVCGSTEVHTSHYNQPTMGCIDYLRGLASKAETLRLGSDKPQPVKQRVSDAVINTMDLETACAEISNSVYATCLLFERLEDRGVLRGNGHHMAQQIAGEAEKLMKERWIQPASPATQQTQT
jgi:hypothetical protein